MMTFVGYLASYILSVGCGCAGLLMIATSGASDSATSRVDKPGMVGFCMLVTAFCAILGITSTLLV